MIAAPFAADLGTFAVGNGALLAQPDALGADAVGIYHLDRVQPSYMEILATINADKDKAGQKSNAYVIFDYQGPNDFKFAGVEVGTNNLQIGSRTADGWSVEAQVPVQAKAATDHDVLLALNGTIATVHFEQATNVSFDFKDALNDGLIGVATHNAIARFDNFQVQKLPPLITFEFPEEFSDPATNPYAVQLGDWQVGAGRYDGAPAGAEFALVSRPLDVAPFSRVFYDAVLSTEGLGGLVFDYYGPDLFKFVALDAAADQVVIGHRDAKGFSVDSSADLVIDPNADYMLGLSLLGATASVTVDEQAVVGHVYNALLNDGDLGLVSRDGASSFDEVTLSGDDPAFASPSALHATGAPTGGAPAESLEPSAALPVLDEASARWSAAGYDVSALTGLELQIADLPELTLGLLDGDAMVLDVDGAGVGWFVDPTPQDDGEFRPGPDDTLVALPGSEASGGMDLLTAVMHEVGHALGEPHAQAGLMADSLAAGTRVNPAGAETLVLTSEEVDPIGLDGPMVFVHEAPDDDGGATDHSAAATATLVFDPERGEFSALETPAEDDGGDDATEGVDEGSAALLGEVALTSPLNGGTPGHHGSEPIDWPAVDDGTDSGGDSSGEEDETDSTGRPLWMAKSSSPLQTLLPPDGLRIAQHNLPLFPDAF